MVDLNYSLHEWIKPKFDSYRDKRDIMIQSLNEFIRTHRNSWAKDISWNEPNGGFFIKMSLPFNIDKSDVSECAARYKVMFCPMRHFYLRGGGENEIRLAFSNLSAENIREGIRRLADFLQSKALASTGGLPAQYEYSQLEIN